MLYNVINKMDGLALIRGLPDGHIATAFFDPQYRGVLDKLSYGNEGVGRGTARCNLPQMTTDTIKAFLEEIERVLKPSGHLFLWVDKFHLCEGVSPWLPHGVSIVDMITWNKQRMGMGYRSRRISEYLIVIQKAPRRAKGCWTSHTIPDVWNEKVIKTHPHAKPIGLQKQLILATTVQGDVVLDPAAGGYSVLTACREANRTFLGADIVTDMLTEPER